MPVVNISKDELDRDYISYDDAVKGQLKSLFTDDNRNVYNDEYGDVANAYSSEPVDINKENFNFGYNISDLKKFRDDAVTSNKNEIINNKSNYYFKKSDLDFILTKNSDVVSTLKSISKDASADPNFPNDGIMQIANQTDPKARPSVGGRKVQDWMNMATDRRNFGYHFNAQSDGSFKGARSIGRHLTLRLDSTNPWFYTSGTVSQNSADDNLKIEKADKRYIENVIGITDAEHKTNVSNVKQFHQGHNDKYKLGKLGDVTGTSHQDDKFLEDLYHAMEITSKNNASTQALSLPNNGMNALQKPSKALGRATKKGSNKDRHLKAVNLVNSRSDGHDFRTNLSNLNSRHTPYKYVWTQDKNRPSDVQVVRKSDGEPVDINGSDNDLRKISQIDTFARDMAEWTTQPAPTPDPTPEPTPAVVTNVAPTRSARSRRTDVQARLNIPQ